MEDENADKNDEGSTTSINNTNVPNHQQPTTSSSVDQKDEDQHARPDSDDEPGSDEGNYSIYSYSDSLSSLGSKPKKPKMTGVVELLLASHYGRQLAAKGRGRKKTQRTKRGRVVKRKRPAPRRPESTPSKQRLDEKDHRGTSRSSPNRRSPAASDVCSSCRRRRSYKRRNHSGGDKK